MGLSYKGSMRKSIHSAEYRRVLVKLVEMRKEAGMTQRELAHKLGREHSFVWRIETGERRLDVIEFYWVCRALGRDATTVYRDVIRGITSSDLTFISETEPVPLPMVVEDRLPYRVPHRKGRKQPLATEP